MSQGQQADTIAQTGGSQLGSPPQAGYHASHKLADKDPVSDPPMQGVGQPAVTPSSSAASPNSPLQDAVADSGGLHAAQPVPPADSAPDAAQGSELAAAGSASALPIKPGPSPGPSSGAVGATAAAASNSSYPPPAQAHGPSSTMQAHMASTLQAKQDQGTSANAAGDLPATIPAAAAAQASHSGQPDGLIPGHPLLDLNHPEEHPHDHPHDLPHGDLPQAHAPSYHSALGATSEEPSEAGEAAQSAPVGASGQGTAAAVAGHLPPLEGTFKWLLPLTTNKDFFKPCQNCGAHAGRDATAVFWDLDDPHLPLCNSCAADPSRQGHTLVQVRRSTYHEVLKAHEAAGLLDVAGVQPYVINNSKVLFLRPRPQPRAPKGAPTSSNGSVCVVDGRQLMDGGFAYCSIRCKYEHEHPDFAAHVACYKPFEAYVPRPSSRASYSQSSLSTRQQQQQQQPRRSSDEQPKQQQRMPLKGPTPAGSLNLKSPANSLRSPGSGRSMRSPASSFHSDDGHQGATSSRPRHLVRSRGVAVRGTAADHDASGAAAAAASRGHQGDHHAGAAGHYHHQHGSAAAGGHPPRYPTPRNTMNSGGVGRAASADADFGAGAGSAAGAGGGNHGGSSRSKRPAAGSSTFPSGHHATKPSSTHSRPALAVRGTARRTRSSGTGDHSRGGDLGADPAHLQQQLMGLARSSSSRLPSTDIDAAAGDLLLNLQSGNGAAAAGGGDDTLPSLATRRRRLTRSSSEQVFDCGVTDDAADPGSPADAARAVGRSKRNSLDLLAESADPGSAAAASGGGGGGSDGGGGGGFSGSLAAGQQHHGDSAAAPLPAVQVPTWGVRVKRKQQQQLKMCGNEVTYRAWPAGNQVEGGAAAGPDVLSDTCSQKRRRGGSVPRSPHTHPYNSSRAATPLSTPQPTQAHLAQLAADGEGLPPLDLNAAPGAAPCGLGSAGKPPRSASHKLKQVRSPDAAPALLAAAAAAAEEGRVLRHRVLPALPALPGAMGEVGESDGDSERSTRSCTSQQHHRRKRLAPVRAPAV